MNAEITKVTDENAFRGWVCYDDHCPLCQRWAARLAPWLHAHAFHLVPLQQPWVRAALGPAATEFREFQFLAPDGRACGGADALLSIAAHVWWARPFCALRRSPLVMRILRAAYRWVADRRHCLGGACAAQASAGRGARKKAGPAQPVSSPKRKRRPPRRRVFFELP